MDRDPKTIMPPKKPTPVAAKPEAKPEKQPIVPGVPRQRGGEPPAAVKPAPAPAPSPRPTIDPALAQTEQVREHARRLATDLFKLQGDDRRSSFDQLHQQHPAIAAVVAEELQVLETKQAGKSAIRDWAQQTAPDLFAMAGQKSGQPKDKATEYRQYVQSLLNGVSSRGGNQELLGQAGRMAYVIKSMPLEQQKSYLAELQRDQPEVYDLVVLYLNDLTPDSLDEPGQAAAESIRFDPKLAGDATQVALLKVLNALQGYPSSRIVDIQGRTDTDAGTKIILDRALAADLVTRDQQGSVGVYTLTDAGLARLRADSLS